VEHVPAQTGRRTVEGCGGGCATGDSDRGTQQNARAKTVVILNAEYEKFGIFADRAESRKSRIFNGRKETMSTVLRTRNPNFRETILNHLHRQEFMKHIGCRLTLIEPGHVVAEIDLQKIHQQQIGFVHGGVIATIADVAAGFAGFTLVAPEEHTVTAELKISYFSPGTGTLLRAVGKVVKPGRNIHFCEADVWSIRGDEEKLIARATTTMAVITPGKKMEQPGKGE
jgi:uncharacterized protein (TIGR00369 family)